MNPLAEDQKKLVFQTLHQLESSMNKSIAGTGLGLGISKHLVDLHGGTIGFDSVPNEHTTFYFTLTLLKP